MSNNKLFWSVFCHALPFPSNHRPKGKEGPVIGLKERMKPPHWLWHRGGGESYCSNFQIEPSLHVCFRIVSSAALIN